MRIALAITAAWLLAGCFASEEPLYERSSTACPAVGTFGMAVIVPNASDDGLREHVTIEALDNGGCHFASERGNGSLVFVGLDKDQWLVQATPSGATGGNLGLGERPTLYALAYRENGAWYAAPLDCSPDRMGDLLQDLGIKHTRREMSVCTATSEQSMSRFASMVTQLEPLPLVVLEPR